MALRFGSASAVYHTIRPMRMRRKVFTLPARPGATSVETRAHGREPVSFRGVIRLVAMTRAELAVACRCWEDEQGRCHTLYTPDETLCSVRLTSVRFSAPKRLVGTCLYICIGVIELRQEVC